MSIDDQQKVRAAGFTIIRKDDHPVPRIKFSSGTNGGWSTLNNYRTKAERDRAFKELLEQKYIIAD